MNYISKTINNKNSKTPIWLMRQAGRYLPEYKEIRKKAKDFLELCYDSDLACEITMQPIRRFDFDAAIIFSDILVIPDSMGINLKFEEQKGPILTPIRTIEELNNSLKNKNLMKLNNVYEAIKKVKNNLDQEKALIGFSGGVWTLASYIVEGRISRDLIAAKTTYYNNKNFFNHLIENLIENIAKHLINQIDAGANVIQIFDSWAGVLTGKDYENLIIKPTNAVIEKVRKLHPDIPIICFPRMSGLNYEKFADEVDCQVLSIDQYMDLSWIGRKIKQKTIQGNLDPLVLLSNSKDFIKERIDEIFSKMKGNNFIFNLGHGVLQQTPVENVEFLVNYVKKNSSNII